MPKSFGLDVGSYSIKALQVSKKAGKYELDNFTEVKTPVSLDTESPTDHQTLAESIRKAYLDAKIKTREVDICLKENQTYSQVVKFPYLSPNELANAISFEAEQFIPVPLDQVHLEYQVLKQPPKGSIVEKMEVLVVAAQKKATERLIKIIKLAGLKPISIETEMLANIRALNVEPTSNNLILSIGQESSDLAFIHKGHLRFIRSLASAGSTFTRALSNQLAMDFNQAEQYKITYGLDERVLEGKVALILKPIANIIVAELKKTLIFLKQNYPKVSVNRIILCGGSANLKKFTNYLADQLALEVAVANPLVNFVKSTNFPQTLAVQKARYTTAVGLAIKSI